MESLNLITDQQPVFFPAGETPTSRFVTKVESDERLRAAASDEVNAGKSA